MKRLRTIAANALIGGWAIAALFVFAVFSLKSCISSAPWKPPVSIESYWLTGGDSHILVVSLFPDGYTVLQYADPQNEYWEDALQRWSGRKGVRYLWRLWRLDGHTGSTYRLFPKGFTPIHLKMEPVSIVQSDPFRASTFPDAGENGSIVVLFSETEMVFEGMTLEKGPEPDLVVGARGVLEATAGQLEVSPE